MVLIETEYILATDLAYNSLKASKCVYNCVVQQMFGILKWYGVSCQSASHAEYSKCTHEPFKKSLLRTPKS